MLTGCSTQGQSSYRRPPERPGHAHRLFDSCVDHERHPNMYIIFNQNQAYPEYLMAYTQVVDALPTRRPAPSVPAIIPQFVRVFLLIFIRPFEKMGLIIQ